MSYCGVLWVGVLIWKFTDDLLIRETPTADLSALDHDSRIRLDIAFCF